MAYGVEDIRTVVRNLLDSDDSHSETFSHLGRAHKINIETIFGLAAIGIVKESSLQNEVLPKLLNDSRDLAIIFPTGTGKSMTAAIAAINYVDVSKSQPQVLYLCATLESAVQMFAIMRRIADLDNVKIGLLVKNDYASLGGKMDYHILVGTPKETVGYSMLFDLAKLSLCIFDDADEVCTTDIVKKHITQRLGVCRKVLLSATSLSTIMDGSYSVTCRKFPVNLRTLFVKVADNTAKLEAILRVYETVQNSKFKAMVFFNTRESLEMVSNILLLKRMDVIVASGKNSPEQRRQMLDEFSEKTPMALCTDVWARAIDIPLVKVVIHFELPRHSTSKAIDKKTIVYRNGRAARFGRMGTVITLVDPVDQSSFDELRATQNIEEISI